MNGDVMPMKSRTITFPDGTSANVDDLLAAYPDFSTNSLGRRALGEKVLKATTSDIRADLRDWWEVEQSIRGLLGGEFGGAVYFLLAHISYSTGGCSCSPGIIAGSIVAGEQQRPGAAARILGLLESVTSQ